MRLYPVTSRPASTMLLVLYVGLGLGCAANAESPAAASAPVGFVPPTSLAPLVDAVEPAVVNVYVTSRQTMRVDPRLPLLLGVPMPATERTVQGQGSGFVISPDGYLLTNDHVVGDADTIKVKFENGDEYSAKLVGSDSESDIALLKVDAKKALPWLKLGNSETLRVGDWVVAIGNPLGLGHTVTAGIVSGKGRVLADEPLNDFIQTDASINPGNSGGPLLAVNGDVVGMNTAIIQNANTVGFAIPASHLVDIVKQLREDGRVSHGYLGVRMAPVPEEGKKQLNVTSGVYLTQIEPAGPAEGAGLRAGDVILKVDGHPISDSQTLLRAVAGVRAGTTVSVTVQRDGKPRDFQVKLGERPDLSGN